MTVTRGIIEFLSQYIDLQVETPISLCNIYQFFPNDLVPL